MTVGRIVHYVSRGSLDGVYAPRHVPLIVVNEDGESIDGWTLNPNGIRYEYNVDHDEGNRPGTWHWPERE